MNGNSSQDEQSSTLLGTKVRHTIEYNYDSLAQLRYIQARCLPLDSIFAGYRRAITELANLSASLLSTNPSQSQIAATLSGWTATHKQRLETYQDHSNALKASCEFTVELLRDRLGFKENSSIWELTKLTVDDSATVRVITVITLAFLSFTVVAVSFIPRFMIKGSILTTGKTIMELPFFHLEEMSEILEVSPQFWIYIAASVPLTILTISYWRFAMWLKARERRRRFPPEEQHSA